MSNRKLWVYPMIFALVLVPVFVLALITYQPGKSGDNNSTTPSVPPHSHYAGMEVAIQNDIQLMFNVSPGAPMYQVTDGGIEQMNMGNANMEQMKHVSVDVRDARLALGERLPVDVSLRIEDAGTGETVFDSVTNVMYAPGHGYHFGNNVMLPNDATYNWNVTVSPAEGLRQEGAVDYWREPVEWEGTFTLDADGAVAEQPVSLQNIGNVPRNGIHITLGYHDAVPLFLVNEQGDVTPQEMPEDSLYFVVDVTDHAVNYEEKLMNAVVVATFTQGDDSFEVPLEPVISPRYGYHYGANVFLDEGDWEIKVTVEELQFMRQAGAATGLPTRPVSATFNFTVPVQ